MAARLRGRPAHAPGPTFLSYTPNGRKLVTVGLNGALRVFQTGSDAEPTTIDVTTDSHTAVAATNDFFVVGSEDGSVIKYSMLTNSMDEILVRCTLPVRDLAISSDGNWAAVASDELEVKVVNTRDMTQVLYLREQSRPVKHVSFDHSGSYLAVSCTDGIVYIYSLSSQQPQLVKRVDGLIKTLETDAEASAKVIWHPDGRAFAAPTATRDIQVISRSDWQRQKSFTSGHNADITAAAWSPNGAMVATAAADHTLVLWETKTQKILKKYDDVQQTILAIHWHPSENILSYTNNDGELFIREDFVPSGCAKLLRIDLQPAPMLNDPLSEVSGNARRSETNGHNPRTSTVHRGGTPNSIDDILGADAFSEDGAGFIEDDDGAGYVQEINRYGKRTNGHLGGSSAAPKRQAVHSAWQPQLHETFQPGSTPWKGERRYLYLNLTGFVWTVNQSSHHTVTVEFFDRQAHRDFHFTDPFMYDKACLSDKGSAFSCRSTSQHPATIYYRPHETWTSRNEWRTQLPADENITSMALSESCIVVTTTADYVRVYTLFGLPYRIYRQKSTPAVTCASWRDYVMTVGNGPVCGNGATRLLYTIENVKRDETFQSEDILPLSEGAELLGVFFSDKGDPCIYDSEGVLLILLHWRTSGQAKWVPLLDTKNLARRASGKKEESYWPVTVANDKFHCIILKGDERYPYFPRPLLSEFDFEMPISSSPPEDEDEDREAQYQRKLDEQHVRLNVLLSLQEDLVQNTQATHAQKAEVSVMEREVDKVLLQLLATECRFGEERGMKALEIASLMKDRSGKMLTAAGKIAARYKHDILGDKIMQLAERRLVGLADEDGL